MYYVLGLTMYNSDKYKDTRPLYYMDPPKNLKQCLTYESYQARIFKEDELDILINSVKGLIKCKINNFKFISELMEKEDVLKGEYKIQEPENLSGNLSKIIICTAIDLAKDMGVLYMSCSKSYDELLDFIEANNYFMYKAQAIVGFIGGKAIPCIVFDNRIKQLCESVLNNKHDPTINGS